MDTIFRNFRHKPGEVWQLDRHQIPLWIELSGHEPFLPWIVICRSVRTGRTQISSSLVDEPGIELFRQALADAARAWRLGPERIEVVDTRLAEELGVQLRADKVAVEVRDDLPELRAHLEEKVAVLRKAAPPGALSGPGVTLEQVAAFARAAARFSDAAPWRHLSLRDHLVLEAPGLPPELRSARVMGPPHKSGVLFHPELAEEEVEDEEDAGEDWSAEDDWGGLDDWDEEADEEEKGEEDWEEEGDFGALSEVLHSEGLWMVSLGSRADAAPDDVDLWERHQLPVAHSRAYPLALRIRPDGFERPGSDLLFWIEGILAALASTTEEEIDAGRWEKEIATPAGPARLAFVLPDLLDDLLPEGGPVLGLISYQMERAMFELRCALERGDQKAAEGARSLLDGEGFPAAEAATPELRAQGLAYEAREMVGRRQILLARRALEVWPDCADAWAVLARRAPDRETARGLFVEAMAAGERALSRIARPEEPGSLAGLFEARPYLQARAGLAAALWDLGAREEAVDHYRGLLALDPDDETGVRYLLAHALLALSLHEELTAHLSRYREDLPEWHYTQALLTFRREGDSADARRHLARALEADPQIGQGFLSEGLPEPTPFLFTAPDGIEEVIDYDELFRDVWADTPGALDWLRLRIAARAASARLLRKGKKKRKGRRR